MFVCVVYLLARVYCYSFPFWLQGFRKVDPDRWEFANEGFLRSQRHLLKTINRRKPAHIHSHQQQQQVQSSESGAFLEFGTFGLEEEVERLKRDKNVLMQELVRLRQQQQATDNQLQNMGQQVQVMEQRQQQIMSFLAKAMHSSGFLTQLVEQQNESNKRIIRGNKKRRFSRGVEENSAGECGSNASHRPIVNYHPSMSESEQTKILKMDAPSRQEMSTNDTDTFLINSNPCSDVTDRGGTLNQILISPTSTNSSMPPKPGFCVNRTPEDMPNIPSSCHVITNVVEEPQISEDSQEDSGILGFSMHELQSSVAFSGLEGPETTNSEFMNMPVALDGNLLVETDVFSSNLDEVIPMNGLPKLPGIYDAFWEEFLTACPLAGTTDEFESISINGGVMEDQILQLGNKNGWNNTQHMNHLTEQMRLMISDKLLG